MTANKNEISYLIITPYTLAKSRTGGVLSRLLSRVDLELVAAQVFCPDEECVKSYAQSMLETPNPKKPHSSKLLSEYILNRMMPTDGRPHRVGLFLFKGEDVCKKLRNISGALFPENRSIESITGETIRDTYADLLYSRTNPDEIKYFEPAVLTPPNLEIAKNNLRIFSRFIKNESNLVENMAYNHPENIERTLVIIKPDNWRFPSSRPGTIIDMFSRTGLRIIGLKIYRMSVAEAEEFYGSVEENLKQKLGPKMGENAISLLNTKFDLTLPKEESETITKSFGDFFAREQFYKIVEFMSGIRPDQCSEDKKSEPGTVKCMIVVYEGVEAINKIRNVLGPTDPSKAPGGTVRREFGHDVMINTAHASDSVESAEREFKIVKIQENHLIEYIEALD